jgi:hypothetical protein
LNEIRSWLVKQDYSLPPTKLQNNYGSSFFKTRRWKTKEKEAREQFMRKTISFPFIQEFFSLSSHDYILHHCALNIPTKSMVGKNLW